MTNTDQPSEFPAGDRAELERMAEREAVLKKAELLAWAYERQAARAAAEHEASKPKAEPAPVRRSHQGAERMTRDWQDYIRAQIETQQRAIMKAVAVAVIDEEKARMQETAGLRERVIALEAELAELRDRETTRRLRAVPTPTALIA